MDKGKAALGSFEELTFRLGKISDIELVVKQIQQDSKMGHFRSGTDSQTRAILGANLNQKNVILDTDGQQNHHSSSFVIIEKPVDNAIGYALTLQNIDSKEREIELLVAGIFPEYRNLGLGKKRELYT